MDFLTKTQRSAHMAKIMGDHLKPETTLSHALSTLGVHHARNVKDLPGTPDMVLVDTMLAVFVHGCFWHACPMHRAMPKTNTKFWRDKFRKNKLRDERVRRRLRAMGYATCVVWEHMIKKSPARAASRVMMAMARSPRGNRFLSTPPGATR